MKRLAITAIAATLVAAPAFAAIDFEATDADGDGFITLPEAMAAYPNLEPTDFDELDVSDDRVLDASEASSGRATAIVSGLETTTPAAAGGFDMATYDTDADQMLTYEELDAVLPGVPRVYFQDFDIDNSGSLDSNEINSGAFQNLLNKYGS